MRKAIGKYQIYTSIKVIRENIGTTNNFSFDLINHEYISKIINNLGILIYQKLLSKVTFQQKL